MAQTRPSPTLSQGFTRLGRFLAPYAVGCGRPRSRWNDSTESSNLAVVQSKDCVADKFKTGDVVRRKSGGPRMTVVSYGEYRGKRKCLCKWFDNRGEPKTDPFLDSELDQKGS